MITTAAIMGLTSYNPYKEAISGIVWIFGPRLINDLSLKPTGTISKIDHIRERLFGIRTQFLQFTQTNTLTKYTWVLLKKAPIGIGCSTLLILFFYHISDPKPAAHKLHLCKYLLSAIISPFITEQDEEIKQKKCSPIYSSDGRISGNCPYFFPPRYSAPSSTGWKDAGPCPPNLKLGKSMPNLPQNSTWAGKYF